MVEQEALTGDDLVNEIVSIIGKNENLKDPNTGQLNYSLKAGEYKKFHIEPLEASLRQTAPLVHALNHETVETAFSLYVTHNKNAIREQDANKLEARYSKIPIWVALVLAVLNILIPVKYVATFLVTIRCFAQTVDAELWWQQYVPPTILLLLMLSSLIKLIQNLKARLRKRKLDNSNRQKGSKGRDYGHSRFELWKRERSAAEVMRQKIFMQVSNIMLADIKTRSDPTRLLLLLEYFRRWQIEVQRDYHTRRPDELRTKSRWAEISQRLYMVLMVILLLVMILAGIASVDEQGPASDIYRHFSIMRFLEGFKLDQVLYLSLALVAFGGFYFVLEAKLLNSKRNSARYDNMLENFEEVLGSRLTEARQQALQGNTEAVLEYISDVHTIMSLESNDWVRLADLDLGRDTHLNIEDEIPV